MTHEDLALALEHRARCIKNTARALYGEIVDSDATSGRDYRDNARAASLAYTADSLRQLAHIIKEGRIER